MTEGRESAGPLADRVALVTGAARGIGRACALRLASAGAEVAVVDIDLDAARATGEDAGQPPLREQLTMLGRDVLTAQADVRDRAQVDAVVAQCLDRWGRLDVLVCNAGGARHTGDHDLASTASPKRFDEVLADNLTSTVACCQSVAPVMTAHRSGRIITIASQAGLWSGRGGDHVPYKVAKGAVVQFSRVLAAELGPHGVTVNCVAPGFVATGRLAARWQAQGRGLTDEIALRRVAQPDEVARVVEFFASDLSAYVTGQCLPVCGGYVAW